MSNKNLPKSKLQVGTWIQIPSPDICEMVGRQGIDWLAVDMEHTGISYDMLSDMFRALKGTSTKPFVRVRSNDNLDIRRALDLGASGVIVPLVETADETKKAVESSKYPPEGKRGFAFCRANNWGVDFDTYAETANKETMVFVMIESKKAVDNIEEILAVEGLDGIFIGPYDMSGSFGVTGQPGHPLVEEACDKVLSACKKWGRIAGKHIVNPNKNYVNNDIKKGFKMIAVGIDTLFIQNGLELLSDIIKEQK